MFADHSFDVVLQVLPSALPVTAVMLRETAASGGSACAF
jgi:hypothetical protein